MRRVAMVAMVAVTALLLGVIPALADGDQTLGTPSTAVASGTGIATGGTGLADTGSGVIAVDVPAGASVQQVLLYWEGQYRSQTAGSLPDDTIEVDGTEVTGALIGTSAFFQDVISKTYRADITDLVAFGPGTNSITVSGLAFGYISNGAGAIVIFDEGGDPATIDIRDGNDGAFFGFPEPRKSTVPQTFTFPASTLPRTASLAMLVSSVNDEEAGSDSRPNLVVVSGDVTTTFFDPFASLSGNHWDSQILTVLVPAGATTLTIEVVSPERVPGGDLPASLFWNAAGLSIAPPPPPDPGCTRTIGYWKTHSEAGPAAYDSTWDARAGGAAAFFGTGMSYIETLQASSAGGNAYLILAQQYIAAELNALAGAAVPAEVGAAMADATALLVAYEDTATIPKRTADRTTAIELAGILDAYNNGLSGPGHCG
jgi:hypothetical protein